MTGLDFVNFPLVGTITKNCTAQEGETNWSEVEKSLERLRHLSSLLKNQTSETIDDFIVENPSYSLLSKICIASSFIKRCFQPVEDRFEVREFAKRYISRTQNAQNRNWVHLLINIARHGIRSGKVTPENRIKIITFNYDKILELILGQQFSNTEAKYNSYTDYIDVLHVHGECGELRETREPAKLCLQWAHGIHVVNEQEVPKNILNQRGIAFDLIRNAEELFFAGFAFSGPNCRLLGLEKPNPELKGRLISFCNFDGNVGITKSVNAYEHLSIAPNDERVETRIEEASGTQEKPLGIANWLRLGYLGELPG